MISKIEINGEATFQRAQTLDGLKKFNYLFGANGTGKTTISRVVDSPENYSSCSVTWENQTPLEARVYNRNFVTRNFNQQKLQGVFTLGEAAQEALDKIGAIKQNIEALQKDIDRVQPRYV